MVAKPTTEIKLEEAMSFNFKLAGLVSGAALLVSAVGAQADVLFWSTQAKPVEEAQAMREQVLVGAGDVD